MGCPALVGRSHEDMVKAREDREASSGRFGVIRDFPGGPLPAPALPNAVIAPRRNPPTRCPSLRKAHHERAPSTTTVVERTDAGSRYEILVDGRRAGLTAYRDLGVQRVFFHTEIDDAFAGQGLAHDEFADITDPVTPDVLRWLKTQLG